MSPGLILDESFWNDRYLTHQTGWDIGNPSPPLTHFFDQLQDKHMAILIPGCGNAYEGEYLWQLGFTNIHLLDISEILTAQLREAWKDRETVNIITGNFFEHTGQYDLIVEQTFFCTLLPGHRSAYSAKMKALLKPGGCLTGLLFDEVFETSPPFGGNKEEYTDVFENDFHIEKMERCYNSIKPRAGRELFFRLRQK